MFANGRIDLADMLDRAIDNSERRTDRGRQNALEISSAIYDSTQVARSRALLEVLELQGSPKVDSSKYSERRRISDVKSECD